VTKVLAAAISGSVQEQSSVGYRLSHLSTLVPIFLCVLRSMQPHTAFNSA